MLCFFRNTDNGREHRDVTVLINDGEKTFEMMTVCRGMNVNCALCLRDRVFLIFNKTG